LAPVFLSAAIYLSKPTKGSIIAGLLSLPLFLILPLWLKFIVPTILLAYSVNAIDHAPQGVLAGLSHPLIVGLGLISYSLYLWQQLFYNMAAGNPLGVLPALITAWISYRYVEVPARKAINSFQFVKLRYS
jgi:peptidoglycan/LPS O-acetylase OafA/YrhL